MLSRTDSIGDVVLTLPMAGALKRSFPLCRVLFLGRTYTRDVIALSEHVDHFINFDELKEQNAWARRSRMAALGADIFLHVLPRYDLARLAFFARIPHRVGTGSRWYHWLFCNHLVRLPRRNSSLHEAQLNLQMMKSLKVKSWYPLEEIPELYGFREAARLPARFASLLDESRKNVILHPLSKGSAAEWGLENFSALIGSLPESDFRIFISGTKEDGAKLKEFISRHTTVHDLTGAMSLGEFISFIRRADALVAASTGPLHIAAAAGIMAIGLYSPRRPIFPRRWAPVGRNAHALVYDSGCGRCRQGNECDCIRKISPQQVAELLKK